MKEKEIAICRDCGKKIEGSSVEIDGEYICQDCFDNNYFYCDDCGRIEEREYGYYIDSCDRFVCDDCLNNNYYKCDDCEGYFERGDVYYIHHWDGNYYVCDDCYSRGDYGCCEGCDNCYSHDDLHYSERDDCYYCDDCYPNEDEYLYDYHAFRDWYFYKGKNEENVPYYIGKEIELEPLDCSDVEGVVNTINNHINAVGMEDGSLDSGGVEVVTHPESWEYLQEHKQNYIDFFENIEHLDYGDNGNAGLHFHVSRPNDNVVSRIIIILESFKEEIKKLSRRNGDFHWSHFLTDYNSDEKKEIIKYQSSKYLKDTYINGYHDRYVALNLNNTKTIEFRFFNGANNFEEFWGALQFIHNIMEIALDEERDVNTIEWKDLIYGEELINQARKQDVLGIDKKANDTTEFLEKLEDITKETKETIKKTLKNLIRFVNKEIVNYNLNDLKATDISQIEKNTTELLSSMVDSTRYLGNIIDVYKRIDDTTIKNTKFYIDNLKNNKYDRYFKQLNKTINKYESEVAA